jgi:5-formyltetrahydrofolate cyclo-ligase
MNGAELKRAKRSIRNRVRAERDTLDPAERTRRGAIAVGRLLELPEVLGARCVLAFWDFGSEVPTGPLLEGLHERGAQVCLPRIAAGDVEPATYSPGDDVEPASFGAMQPVGGRVVEPERIDVIVTPAVAFDEGGGRIGYGGGFYDRLFRRVRPNAFRVGLGFDLQVVGGDLPQGPFDARLDAVVTDARTLRFARTH